MGWYKFRNGMLVEEEVVSAQAERAWQLSHLYREIIDGGYDNPHRPKPSERRLVDLGFLDHADEKVWAAPEEMFGFRLREPRYGWGRMFGGRPGKLIGYRTGTEDIVAVCELTRLENGNVYTWNVIKDKLDIEPMELKDMCGQLWELEAMFMDKFTYPALF